MIDETNVCVLEPTEALRFKSRYHLEEHIKKHIFNRDEKWWKIGFDRETISAAQNGDASAMNVLGRLYEKTVSDIILDLCRCHRDHLHILAIRPKYPQTFLERFPEREFDDRMPQQIVKCWGILTNLVIVAKSDVRNDSFGAYRISTGYRTYPKRSKESWLKQEMSHEREESELYQGKEQILIADHMK